MSRPGTSDVSSSLSPLRLLAEWPESDSDMRLSMGVAPLFTDGSTGRGQAASMALNDRHLGHTQWVRSAALAFTVSVSIVRSTRCYPR